MYAYTINYNILNFIYIYATSKGQNIKIFSSAKPGFVTLSFKHFNTITEHGVN